MDRHNGLVLTTEMFKIRDQSSRTATMPKKGEKTVVQTPFDYYDMRDDQSTISFLPSLIPEQLSI